MNNHHHPLPTPESELRNVVQAITTILDTVDPMAQRLSVPREDLERWGHQIAAVVLTMDLQQEGSPALGCGWGLVLVVTVGLMVAGLWLLRHC